MAGHGHLNPRTARVTARLHLEQLTLDAGEAWWSFKQLFFRCEGTRLDPLDQIRSADWWAGFKCELSG